MCILLPPVLCVGLQGFAGAYPNYFRVKTESTPDSSSMCCMHRHTYIHFQQIIWDTGLKLQASRVLHLFPTNPPLKLLIG